VDTFSSRFLAPLAGEGRGGVVARSRGKRPGVPCPAKKRHPRCGPHGEAGCNGGVFAGLGTYGLFSLQAWRPSAGVTQRSGKPKATGATDAARPGHRARSMCTWRFGCSEVLVRGPRLGRGLRSGPRPGRRPGL